MNSFSLTMGRSLESIEQLIARNLDKAAEKHSDKSLKRDKNKIFCQKCAEHVSFIRGNLTSRITEHLKSFKHKQNISKASSRLITDQIEKAKQKKSADEVFNCDLLDTFLGCDIPLHKLSMDKMKQFLAKYCPNQNIPHPNTLRTRIESQAEEKIRIIREIIGDSEVFFQIDETSDRKSRNVVNVIVGKLDDTISKPMLLNVAFQTVTNHSTIQNVIFDSCQILWPNTNRYKKLVLLLSDQAAYMVLAGKELKAMKAVFPNLSHVTCIVHAISLVCNSIMKEFYLVNKLFTLEQNWFKNSNKRKRDYHRFTNLKLIPTPILIRWGTWIACANYHRANLSKIKDYFEHCDGSNSKSLDLINKMMKGQKIGNDILRLTDKYSEIPSLITKLEAENLRMDKQLEYLESVKTIIAGTSHSHILENSLRKNPDFSTFVSSDNRFEDRVKRTFAPLTTCSVERSFSVFRSLFRDNRANITTRTLRNMMIMKFNNFLP